VSIGEAGSHVKRQTALQTAPSAADRHEAPRLHTRQRGWLARGMSWRLSLATRCSVGVARELRRSHTLTRALRNKLIVWSVMSSYAFCGKQMDLKRMTSSSSSRSACRATPEQ
jgi:hypothetical protein